MTDVYRQQHHLHHRSEPRAHQVVKAATAATAGGSFLVLSGLTLTATVIALTVATPLLVIFSPVLVPAAITVFLLATGFLISGGFGITAATVLAWLYRYVMTGEHTTGNESSLNRVRYKMGSKVGDTGRGHHATGGVRLTTGARTGLYES